MEFALILLVFLELIVACIDIGRYFLVEHQVRTVASESARAALVAMQSNTDRWDLTACTFSGGTASTAMQKVLDLVPGLAQGGLSISCSVIGAGLSTTKQITVNVRYVFNPISPIWSSDRTLNETSVISY